MTDTSAQIDTIVREVLRRLESDRPSTPAGARPPQCHVPGRVVSLEQLERHACADRASQSGTLAQGRIAAGLTQIRRITVDPGAVVTPAVLDLLRDLGITLAKGKDHSGGSAGRRAVIVCVAPARLDTRQLTERLGASVRLRALACSALQDAVMEAARAAGSGDGQAVVVTRQAIGAVCLANRHRGVRAAACYDSPMLQQARDTIGINVLALDPARLEPGVLLGLAVQFCGQPVAPCPAGWDDGPQTH